MDPFKDRENDRKEEVERKIEREAFKECLEKKDGNNGENDSYLFLCWPFCYIKNKERNNINNSCNNNSCNNDNCNNDNCNNNNNNNNNGLIDYKHCKENDDFSDEI